jgi:hypothetical protein
MRSVEVRYSGLVFALLLCGCPVRDIYFSGAISPRLQLADAWKETASKEYYPDFLDYWKSPAQFIRDNGGDCEDFAIYMIYLLGDTASMAIIKDSESNTHAVVFFRGEYLEAQQENIYYNVVPSDIYEIIQYNALMAIATAGGTK